MVVLENLFIKPRKLSRKKTMLRYKRTHDKANVKPAEKPADKPVEMVVAKTKKKDPARFKDPKFLALNNAKIWSAIYALSKKNK